ncbi:alpha/beta hydrolase family protein [Paenibacillus sp. GCM10027626]|uniref:alpha/beta hydrolase family protein n=1 Tax=Paenibacillus sp. GCM10027626 TaxID=3273411 RepID=UPI0036405DB9
MLNWIKERLPGTGKLRRITGSPLPARWKGGAAALTVLTLLFVVIQANYMLGDRGVLDSVIGTIVALIAVALAGGLLALLVHLLKKIPGRYLWLAFSAFILIFICFMGPMQVSLIFVIAVITLVTIWGAIIYPLAVNPARYFTGLSRAKKAITLGLAITITAVLALGGLWVIQPGSDVVPGVPLQQLKTSERYSSAAIAARQLTDPAAEGSYSVKTLTYGSPNSYRPEFNRSDSLVTQPVDGSAYVSKWSSLRTKTVGFGPDKMPLNGTVWYPDGKGPFPLVVIVHGNHLMTDYSDPGYDYLGELLASRGYIFVSIDENFLNVSPYDDMFIVNALEKENPARGLLMLEHLKTWKGWNEDPGTPFYRQVDMEQIALIGHSRGGEAITVAAAYNQLNQHPDNGNIKFDYNFSIRSIIAIAGTDRQYNPADHPMPVKHVNYLALHGSHDMDVNSFRGQSQYHRVTLAPDEDLMKATVYIYGANHGQFNRSWSRGDGAGLGNQLFNLQQLMPRAQQEQTAKVFISAFLDATLKHNTAYRDIFQDAGYAKEWLPDTMYVTNYMDSQTKVVAAYNEDIDLQSTTLPGGMLTGEGLAEWKEEAVKMKFGEDLLHAVRLGWDQKRKQEQQPNPASYTVTLPAQSIHVDGKSSLVFSIADAGKEAAASYAEGLIDLTIRVVDQQGHEAQLPLSHISPLIPAIEGKLLKAPFDSFGETKEPLFQYYSFPLQDFKQQNAKFNPQQLSKVSFVFDKTAKGTVLLNDIGIRP